MDSFDLKIRYPHHIDLNDVEQFGTLNTIGILTRFDRMGWKQQLSRWLQLDGASPTFTITDERDMFFLGEIHGNAEDLLGRFGFIKNGPNTERLILIDGCSI